MSHNHIGLDEVGITGLLEAWSNRFDNPFPGPSVSTPKRRDDLAELRIRRRRLGSELERVIDGAEGAREKLLKSGIPIKQMLRIFAGEIAMTPEIILSLFKLGVISAPNMRTLAEFYMYHEVDPHFWEMMNEMMYANRPIIMSPVMYEGTSPRQSMIMKGHGPEPLRINGDYVMGRVSTPDEEVVPRPYKDMWIESEGRLSEEDVKKLKEGWRGKKSEA